MYTTRYEAVMSLSYRFDFETPEGLFEFYSNEGEPLPLVSIRVCPVGSSELALPSVILDLDCDEVAVDLFYAVKDLLRCCIRDNTVAVFDDIAKILAGIPLRGNRFENGRRASDPPEVTYFRMLDEEIAADSEDSDVEKLD